MFFFVFCLILVSISLNEFDIERKFSNLSDVNCLYFAHFILNHHFNIQIDLEWHNLLDNVSQIWLFILIILKKKKVNGPMNEKEFHWLIVVWQPLQLITSFINSQKNEIKLIDRLWTLDQIWAETDWLL